MRSGSAAHYFYRKINLSGSTDFEPSKCQGTAKTSLGGCCRNNSRPKHAPDHKEAADELVKGFQNKDEIISSTSTKILNDVIVPGPPALVRALIPLLKDKDAEIRVQTAALLAKIDPKAMLK